MERDTVDRALGHLIAGTGGQESWSDVTVELYAEEFHQLDDDGALLHAAKVTCETWASPSRPPLSVILEAYRSEVRRKQMARPALPPPTHKMPATFGEGVAIAKRAYEAECYRQRREPNPAQFAKWVGSTTPRPVLEGEPEPW